MMALCCLDKAQELETSELSDKGKYKNRNLSHSGHGHCAPMKNHLASNPKRQGGGGQPDGRRGAPQTSEAPKGTPPEGRRAHTHRRAAPKGSKQHRQQKRNSRSKNPISTPRNFTLEHPNFSTPPRPRGRQGKAGVSKTSKGGFPRRPEWKIGSCIRGKCQCGR